MARHRYLVAYDIADPRRLRMVHACVTGFGFALQYSVFLCDLSPMELVDLRSELRDIIHHREDRVVVIDLGVPGTQRVEFLGRHSRLPATGGATIV